MLDFTRTDLDDTELSIHADALEERQFGDVLYLWAAGLLTQKLLALYLKRTATTPEQQQDAEVVEAADRHSEAMITAGDRAGMSWICVGWSPEAMRSQEERIEHIFRGVVLGIIGFQFCRWCFGRGIDKCPCEGKLVEPINNDITEWIRVFNDSVRRPGPPLRITKLPRLVEYGAPARRRRVQWQRARKKRATGPAEPG